MVMIVDSSIGSFTQLYKSKVNDATKNKPHIKASLDKNKSQRIGILV
jgi:hypothetical protein